MDCYTYFLQVENRAKLIQWPYIIFDFTMFIWYLLYNNKIFTYIKFSLYRLKKIKIAFENNCPIDVILFRPIYNDLKFYVVIHLNQFIWAYISTINYNTL